MTVSYTQIKTAFSETSLVVRGGFAIQPSDDLPGSTVVMIGNVGAEMWSDFSATRPDVTDPLDTWTKSVIAPIASTLGATAIYPNDRPYRPFQQWAMRAEPVQPSPLGILIHPEFGLWHAYRAALVFADTVHEIPKLRATPRPCNTCADKPCLSTCPVDAFTGQTYDVPACIRHLKTPAGQSCHTIGCLARMACPVGTEFQTTQDQRAFHTAAFFRSNG